MEGYGYLDSFIEECDASRLTAFLEHVQKRFLEAQNLKRQKIQELIANHQNDLQDQLHSTRRHVAKRIEEHLRKLKALKVNQQKQLLHILESLRREKSLAQNKFSDIEVRVKELALDVERCEKEFSEKKEIMDRRHKQELRKFFESAVRGVCDDKANHSVCDRTQERHLLMQLLIAIKPRDVISTEKQ